MLTSSGLDSLRPELSDAPYFAFGGKVCDMFVRSAEVERIVKLLTDGTCVDLVGTRWSGRTEVMRNVNKVLDERGYTVIAVSGVGDELPLEAVRVALPLKYRRSLPDRPGRFAAIVDVLGTAVADGRVVILVDDLDLLDSTSWVALETVHKSTGVPIFGTSLTKAPTDNENRTLIKVAHPVVRISLAPLKPDMTREILEAHLGGRVAADLSGRIHSKSSGMPGFTVAIADALRDSSSLRLRNDTWVGEDDLWSDELSGAYESLLVSYSTKAREALEMLAIIGVTDLSAAIVLIGQDMIEELEDNSLITLFTASERTLVAVNPQGLASYFRHQPISARRLRLVDEITKRLEVSDSESLDEAYEKWRTAASLETSTLDAALPWEQPAVTRMFMDESRIRLALAREVWDNSPSPQSAIDLWVAELSDLSNDFTPPPAFADYLASTASASLDISQALALRYLHSRWQAGNGASLATVVESFAVPADASPELRSGLELLEFATRMELDSIPADYESQIGRLLPGDALGLDVQKLVLAMGHVFSARPEDALRVLETVSNDGPRILRVHAQYLRGLALFGAGRQLEAFEEATKNIDAAISSIDSLALVANSFVAAFSLTAFGRFDEAWEIGELVSGLGISSVPVLFSPDRALFMVQAVGAFNNGRAAAGETFIENAYELKNRSDGLPLAGPDWDAAGSHYPAGSDPRRAASYRELAESLKARGYLFAASVASYMSLSSQYDDAYRRVVEDSMLAIGGELYRGYLIALRGVYEEKPKVVLEGAKALRAVNGSVAASRFYAIAARLFRDQGKVAEARQARATAREMEDLGSFQTQGFLGANGVSETLSLREMEIALLIAGGLSNAQIAARLVLSTRTIESHINRISRKTGAVDRADIASLARK